MTNKLEPDKTWVALGATWIRIRAMHRRSNRPVPCPLFFLEKGFLADQIELIVNFCCNRFQEWGGFFV